MAVLTRSKELELSEMLKHCDPFLPFKQLQREAEKSQKKEID